jgi:hypothetical protein
MSSDEMKYCPKCKTERPILEFWKSLRHQPTSFCRLCCVRRKKSVNSLFSFGKSRAKNRKVEWGLSLEEFTYLRSKPCTYCDGPLPESGAGIDRVDSALGYVRGNTIPSCAICNHLKHSNLSFDEMTDFIGPAVKEIRKRRGLGPNDHLLMLHQRNYKRRPYRPRRKGGILENGHLTSLPARRTDELET